MYKPSTAYEMGGYFSFCSFRDIPENWGDLQKFQSARAALECFLQQADHIENIYLPYFICDTVLSAVKAAKKEMAPVSVISSPVHLLSLITLSISPLS